MTLLENGAFSLYAGTPRYCAVLPKAILAGFMSGLSYDVGESINETRPLIHLPQFLYVFLPFSRPVTHGPGTTGLENRFRSTPFE